jgi:hypothetical protein
MSLFDNISSIKKKTRLGEETKLRVLLFCSASMCKKGCSKCGFGGR